MARPLRPHCLPLRWPPVLFVSCRSTVPDQRRIVLAVLIAMLLSAGCGNMSRGQVPSLYDAAVIGDLSAVRRAVEAGAPLDAKGASGETALLASVNAGHDGVAMYLIERGASLNIQADNLDSPWLQAGALGRAAVIKAMLLKGPDLSVRNRFGGNALIPACERGHVETVKVLLTSGIDVNHVNNLGWTALLEAVILGRGAAEHQQIVRLLLDAGADPLITDREGVSPLEHARRRGFKEIEALLASR